MADKTSDLFTEKALDKLRSPDDLYNYLRVTNPSIWVLLFACVFLIAGLLVWAVFGTLSSSVDTVGTCLSGEVVCFLPYDRASAVHVGNSAKVNGELVQVASVSRTPVSRAEASDIVDNGFLADMLIGDDWVYVVRLDGEAGSSFEEDIPLPVSIASERVAPISLILGGKK